MTEPVNPDEPIERAKHNKHDYTIKGWDRKIEEEEASWRQLDIDLKQMNFSGHDLFFLTAKVQALTNIIIEGDLSEENLNLNLKMIVYESMQEIRFAIEPQIMEMRAQIEAAKARGAIEVPEIIMPWQTKNRHGNGI